MPFLKCLPSELVTYCLRVTFPHILKNVHTSKQVIEIVQRNFAHIKFPLGLATPSVHRGIMYNEANIGSMEAGF